MTNVSFGKIITASASVLLASIITTAGSYAIVTDRNIALDPLKNYATITGQTVINLPCAPADTTNWESDKPQLPETRGIPVNYHFWNPCEGNKILRNGFLLDIGFWIIVYGACLYLFIHSRSRRVAKRIN